MSQCSMNVGGKTKYKIVVLGDQYVGKTAIIDRFINDRFQESYSATVGIDFLVRNFVNKNKTYRLQLWDTAGQQRFKSLIPSYLKDSNCAVIVYDLTSTKSLENTSKWLQLYSQHKDETAFAVLVGNKNDKKTHACTEQLINQKIQQLNIKEFKISAKTGQGVNELFGKIIDLINYQIANIKIIDMIEQSHIQEDFVVPQINNQTVNTYKSTNVIKLSENKSEKIHKKCC